MAVHLYNGISMIIMSVINRELNNGVFLSAVGGDGGYWYLTGQMMF